MHKRIVELTFERGLSATGMGGTADYKNGDDIRFAPPFTTTPDQVDAALAIIDESLTQLEADLGVT